MPHKLGWLVEDYGAVGNGSTDDSGAFNALVSGMGTWIADTQRQVCNLRPRTYAVSSTITVNQSGICFEGQDRVGSVIHGTASLGASAPVIDVVSNSGNTQVLNFELNNLRVSRANPGPLVRMRGVIAPILASVVLSNGAPYVIVDKPGTAINRHILLDHVDCIGGQAAVGIDCTSVDALRVHHCRIACNGAGSIMVRVNGGAQPSLMGVGGINFATYLHVRSTTKLVKLYGGWKDTAVFTRWIDSESSTRGVWFGRKITTNVPSGTWGMFGPIHN